MEDLKAARDMRLRCFVALLPWAEVDEPSVGSPEDLDWAEPML